MLPRMRLTTEEARKDMDSWSACIVGALTDSDYRSKPLAADFAELDIEHISDSKIGEYPFRHYSSHIKARKTHSGPSRVR